MSGPCIWLTGTILTASIRALCYTLLLNEPGPEPDLLSKLTHPSHYLRPMSILKSHFWPNKAQEPSGPSTKSAHADATELAPPAR